MFNGLLLYVYVYGLAL